MVGNAAGANRFFKSTTHFGREYMGFSDAIIGQDMPRQYDDFFFDRVSQIGPAESPPVADSSTVGSITPGVHQCAVVFAHAPGILDRAFAASFVDFHRQPGERDEYSHRPVERGAAPVDFHRGSGRDFLQRACHDDAERSTPPLRSPSISTIRFFCPARAWIIFFSQIELPEQLGVVDYAERLFLVGRAFEHGQLAQSHI